MLEHSGTPAHAWEPSRPACTHQIALTNPALDCAAKFADGSAPEPKRQRSGYTEKTLGYPLKNSGLAGSEQARLLLFNLARPPQSRQHCQQSAWPYSCNLCMELAALPCWLYTDTRTACAQAASTSSIVPCQRHSTVPMQNSTPCLSISGFKSSKLASEVVKRTVGTSLM